MTTTEPAPPPTLRLAPDRGRAGVWLGLALLLVAMCVWLVGDSSGAVIAWIALALAIGVALYFLVPVLAPELTTLVLDEDRVRGRSYHADVEVAWDQVQVARVVRVAGEPVLELHVREPSPTGDPWRTRPVGILLPPGCDLDALHDFLAVRLGRRA